jgi:hypothetical protein
MNVESRALVIEKAKERLSSYAWYAGVCVDGLDDYRDDEIEAAVDRVVSQSIYWDAPQQGFGELK